MCNFFCFWQGTPTIFGCSKIFFCSSIKIFIQLQKVCQHFSECIRLVVPKRKVLIICVYACAYFSVQIRLFLTHSVKRLRSIALTIHTEGSYQGWFCCCGYCYYCWRWRWCNDFVWQTHLYKWNPPRCLLQTSLILNNSSGLIISQTLLLLLFRC